MSLYRKCGIYIIHCSKNKKVYIGSSINIGKRWTNHRTHLRNNTHSNQHLQNSWNKHGELTFSFSLIELCPKENLVEREMHWINFYGSIDNKKGYNLCYPDVWGRKTEIRERKINILRNPRSNIIILHKNKGYIAKVLGYKTACELTGATVKKIERIISYWSGGRGKSRICNNYTFIKEAQYNEEFDYFAYKKEKVLKPKKEFPYRKNPEDIIPYEKRNIRRRPIKMIEITSGNEELFKSASWAVKKYDLLRSKVYKCLKYPIGRYSHRGYYYEYLSPREG